MDKEVKQFNSFEQLYKRNLSESEISEINQNLIGFFKLLIEIDLEQKKK
jgi:hypothetical protein